MSNDRDTYLPLVKSKAQRCSIDWKLVDAIIQTESGYNAEAMRFEPTFRSLVIPIKFARINRISIATETQLQKFSLGLGQIMAGTARGLGFNHPIPRLLDPETNLEWVCKHILNLHTQYTFQNDIISVYNWGSLKRDDKGKYRNQSYVDTVLSFLVKSS